MRKVVIFTEGRTELIFVRELLLKLSNYTKLNLECYDLISDRYSCAPYPYTSDNSIIYFMLVNVQGDERVLSVIRDREKHLIETGKFDIIIGLRDMYSEAYKSLSGGRITDSITRRFIDSTNSDISTMTYPDKIIFFFAIMEIEAWLLAMYNIFYKIDHRLTVEFINGNLGINLNTIDPQNYFFKPSNQVRKILALIGRKYNKKIGDIENIIINMDQTDYNEIINRNVCNSFAVFQSELSNLLN